VKGFVEFISSSAVLRSLNWTSVRGMSVGSSMSVGLYRHCGKVH